MRQDMKRTWRRSRPASAAGALALAAILLLPDPSAGQVIEDERGFSLGLGFVGSSVHSDRSDSTFYIKDGGGGLVLDAGYRFNRHFKLVASLSGAVHDTSVQGIEAGITSIRLFGVYRFAPGGPFRPYFKGGFGGYAVQISEGDISAIIEGGGLSLGTGFDFFFTPHFSLGVDLTTSIIRYDEAQLRWGDFSVGGNVDENGAQTTIGITFGYGF